MKPGEQFELDCYEYLKNLYTTKETTFCHEGGMDSTKSDISVVKNGLLAFYIEVKDKSAQSGQFVLLPNKEKNQFVFSPRNTSQIDESVNIIINYMNNDFQRFNNAETAGQKLDIDKDVFITWVIQHYKDKNVKYLISFGKDYVILPIDKFGEYFDISANYRIKKSGSVEPAKKSFALIKQVIKEHYPSATFYENGKKLFINLSEKIINDRFIIGDNTYYFSKKETNNYEIKKLSNTYNMNVIFSIKLIKEQDINDLEKFKLDL